MAGQRAMPYGDGQHDDGGACHPQPDHVERVESRLDQGFGGDSRPTEGQRRGERETEPHALAPAAPTAV